MSSDANIGVRLNITGADAVKARLAEVRQEMQRGNLTADEYIKLSREQSRLSGVLTNAKRAETRAFLAQHPVLNQTVRSLSAVASVGRTLLAVSTAFSVATLALTATSAEVLSKQAEIRELQRELAIELAKASPDAEKIRKLNDELNIANAELNDLLKNADEQKVNSLLGLAGSLAAVAGGMSQIALAAPGLGAALGPLGGLAAGAALGLYLRQLLQIKGTALDLEDDVNRIFNTSIPAAISASISWMMGVFLPAMQLIWEFLTAGWNTYLDTINRQTVIVSNAMLSAVEAFVNGAIGAINVLIKQYNSFASKLGLATIKPLALIHLERIPLPEQTGGGGTSGGAGASDTGNRVLLGPTSPFPGQGSAVPAQGSSVGKIVTVNVTVQGSVIAQNDLVKVVLKALADEQNRRGTINF